jgi:bilirubin oxidase
MEFETARNAYFGQEGVYILHDAEEQALGLPSGEYDIGLVLGAKIYNQDGSLQFDDNGYGLWGDVIEV